ncbi:MAG: nuclear transport factor 2 family protein [Pseudomonadales bacterium]|nr:nuclear transport factor 2 family protein [Pseudomonadales bacterium]
MKCRDFIPAYERALATQKWSEVAPLVSENACVTFSSGTVHKGKDAVRRAFEQNFQAIEDESYKISNVHWVLEEESHAAYIFEFDWAGLIDGKPARGGGTGTCVLAKEGDQWRLLVEHLGPRA